MDSRVCQKLLLHPASRCEAVQSVEVNGSAQPFIPARPGFKKDPQRWAATPGFRLKLHHELNAKLAAIEGELEKSPLNFISNLQSSISDQSEIRNQRSARTI